MENRRNHPVQVAVVALTLAWALVLLWQVPAAADQPNNDPFTWKPTITVDTNPDAVVVDSSVNGRVPGGTVTQASGSGSNCRVQPASGVGSILWPGGSNYPVTNLFPFSLWCDGSYRGLVWLRVSAGGAPPGNTQSPQDIAMWLRDRIPIPRVTIEMNPEPGLVGVESWFWIDGYDGSPIAHSTDAFGRTVEVEASVLRYEWSFGDGSRLVGYSVGNPYPERSDVRHVYQRSSLGYPTGYPVKVAFVFSARYRVNGGGWIDLPGITRVAQALYPVQESQAVIGR
jgi:hypothetical protein